MATPAPIPTTILTGFGAGRSLFELNLPAQVSLY